MPAEASERSPLAFLRGMLTSAPGRWQEALQASNDNCRRAYAQGDADAAGKVDVFGQKQSRLYVLMINATHDNEHYGNIVTYLRMNGMVPPSSRPRGGN